MKFNLKMGLGALAVLLVGLGVFGLRESSTNAAVAAGNVYIIGQRPIAGTTDNKDCSKAAGSRQVNIANFPPAIGSYFLNTGTTISAATGLPTVEIQNLSAASSNLDTTNSLFTAQNFVFICVNANTAASSTTTAANPPPPNGCPSTTSPCYNKASIGAPDGDISFSAIVQSNMGYFGGTGAAFPTCTDPNVNGVVGETSPGPGGTADNCLNTAGNGTAQLEIPVTGNDLTTVIVPFTCSNPSATGYVGSSPFATTTVMPVTIAQNQGSVTFNIICKLGASAATTTISATPSTVEIIPARSNTSHSLILMKIQSALFGPVFPGTDAEFTVLASSTAKCSIETAGMGVGTSAVTDVFGNIVTNVPSLGTLADGPNILSIGSAIALTSALNTSAPGTYLTWEYSAPAQVPIDVLGGFAPFGTNAFSPASDITKAVDGFDLNGDGIPDFSIAAAILSCNPLQAPGVTAGVVNVQGCVAVLNAVDVCQTTTIKVIGPPAAITITASPTTVNCGEKSTITATVVDSIGQPVSDHTRVELVTNIGGVLGGTGAVAGFAAEVAPVSSSVADTFGGVATGFLITSTVHSGPYEVIATSGGTTSGDHWLGGGQPGDVFGNIVTPQYVNSLGQLVDSVTNVAGTPINTIGNFQVFGTQTFLGGQFSTPPISAQVTVTCSLPVVAAPAAPAVAAPAITAPRTGTGITPPNTGDAGLVGSSTSGTNWSLFAIGGIVALTLAGFATAKAARR